MPNFKIEKDFSTNQEENNAETRSLPGYIDENTTTGGYNEESISLPGHVSQEASVYKYDHILLDTLDEKKLLPSYSLSVDDESRAYMPEKTILPSYDQICQAPPGSDNGNVLKNLPEDK